jgi:hypothetical protein
LVALPLGVYFLKNPKDFFGRAAPISILAAENPLRELGKSLILHSAMFNFYGDGNWRHNFSGSPQLFWPIGLLFLLGIAISTKSIIKSFQKRDYLTFLPYSFLFSWCFTMLLPGILTYEGIPHALRVIGVIPTSYIFAALGGNYLCSFLNNKVKNKKLLIIFWGLFLSSLFFHQFNKYFFAWASHQEIPGAFSRDYVEMGKYLNSLPESVKKYVVVNQSGVPVPWPDGIPMPAQTLMFIERTKSGTTNSTYLVPEELEKIKEDKEIVILVMRYDENIFNKLKERFPQGKTEDQNGVFIFSVNNY